MKYTIGDIVTIISPLDAGDEDYLNKTGVIQEITKNDNEPDRLIYGVRFNSFATDTDRYFYDTQIRHASEYEMSVAYRQIMNIHLT